MIKENLAYVENEIQRACQNCGRAREDVTLIAVSKTKPVSDLREAYDLAFVYSGRIRCRSLLTSTKLCPKISNGI